MWARSLRLAKHQRGSGSPASMASDSWIAASMRQSDAEIDTIAARPLGKRGAASRRSSVSSRRLCGAHNSAIAGGQDRSVDAATATVANQQPDALRKQQRGGLAPFGLRIIRAMQPSAVRGKTAECVANHSRTPYEAGARASSSTVCEPAHGVRAYAAVERRVWRLGKTALCCRARFEADSDGSRGRVHSEGAGMKLVGAYFALEDRLFEVLLVTLARQIPLEESTFRRNAVATCSTR